MTSLKLHFGLNPIFFDLVHKFSKNQSCSVSPMWQSNMYCKVSKIVCFEMCDVIFVPYDVTTILFTRYKLYNCKKIHHLCIYAYVFQEIWPRTLYPPLGLIITKVTKKEKYFFCLFHRLLPFLSPRYWWVANLDWQVVIVNYFWKCCLLLTLFKAHIFSLKGAINWWNFFLNKWLKTPKHVWRLWKQNFSTLNKSQF